MWDTLSRADLEEARQQLRSRREQMLHRHAEELAALDNDEADVQTLNQLIGSFVEKFKLGSTLKPDPAATSSTETDDEQAGDQHTRPGVSLLITQAQKSKLRELGIADEEIRRMRPDEAHRILGLAS